MRILVSGDRHWTDRETIRLALEGAAARGGGPVTVIHGGAAGADAIAGELAASMGFAVEVFEADWARFGRAAGPTRNAAMVATRPDLVLAFHPDLATSRGTRDLVSRASRAGLEVIVLPPGAPFPRLVSPHR